MLQDKIKSIEIVGCGVVVTFDDGWKITVSTEQAKELVRKLAVEILTK